MEEKPENGNRMDSDPQILGTEKKKGVARIAQREEDDDQ